MNENDVTINNDAGLIENNQRNDQSAPVGAKALGDNANILRPGIDYLDDVAVATVAIQERNGFEIGWVPVAVTSEREMSAVRNNRIYVSEREYLFYRQPQAIQKLARWRREDIDRYCGGGEPVNPLEFFRHVLALHTKYLDYPVAGAAEVLALWCIGTYFHPLFPAYPYVELNGPKGSGKSKQLRLTSNLAFNGYMIVEPSNASIFRLIEAARATICFDEAETLKTEQRATLLQILNAGYTAGGTVIRCEDGGRGLREFEVYSPKMFASIRGIDSTTAMRCIGLQLLRSRDKAKGRLAITDNSEPWAEIRHGLYSLALTEFKAIRETYKAPEVQVFENRDHEKWSPILTLALFFERHGHADLRELVTKFAHQTIDESADCDLPLRDKEVLLLLHDRAQMAEFDARPTDLLETLRTRSGAWKRQSPENVGHILKHLGFTRGQSRRLGSSYHVALEQIEDVAARYGVDLGQGNDPT